MCRSCDKSCFCGINEKTSFAYLRHNLSSRCHENKNEWKDSAWQIHCQNDIDARNVTNVQPKINIVNRKHKFISIASIANETRKGSASSEFVFQFLASTPCLRRTLERNCQTCLREHQFSSQNMCRRKRRHPDAEPVAGAKNKFLV